MKHHQKTPEQVDPTQVRLSKYFMLSDFMGCESVYKGLSHNRITRSDEDIEKLYEFRLLAENFLDPIVERIGSLSVSYGYISPQLSRACVKYQDPDKPSYHRGDLGAAADIIVHEYINEANASPIEVAAWIDQYTPRYARLITYSESPYLCLASSSKEGGRRALYENRYVEGQRKPQFINYGTGNKEGRLEDAVIYQVQNPGQWRGQGLGYPTYHGGGRKQCHHERISMYSMLSDYLYSRTACYLGSQNIPTEKLQLDNIKKAGKVYDEIVKIYGRCPIVRAFEHGHISPNSGRDYRNGFIFDIIPPEGLDLGDVTEDLKEHFSYQLSINLNRKLGRIKVSNIKGKA